MTQRTASDLVFGLGGPVVVVSGRVAAILNHKAKLDDFRVKVRGIDPELDASLAALKFVAEQWRTSATGSPEAPVAEAAASSEWVSTSQAGNDLHVTDRAIRLAIKEGRLEARQVGRAWRIHREELQHFKEVQKGRTR